VRNLTPAAVHVVAVLGHPEDAAEVLAGADAQVEWHQMVEPLPTASVVKLPLLFVNVFNNCAKGMLFELVLDVSNEFDVVGIEVQIPLRRTVGVKHQAVFFLQMLVAHPA